MRKEVEFSARLDTSDFDRVIDNLQRKLREAYRPADIVQSQAKTSQRLEDMGMPGILSKPTQEAFKKSMDQSKVSMDKLIADEARGMEKTGKLINERAKMLERLKKLQGELVTGSQEELKVKETIGRVEENQYKMRENYKQRDQMLNQAMNVKEKMGQGKMGQLKDAFEEGGFGGMAKAGLNMMGPTGRMLGAGAAVIGAAGTAVNAGVNAWDYLQRSPFRTDLNRGQAAESLVSQPIQAMRTPYGQAFMKERGIALGEAENQTQISRKGDAFRGPAGLFSGERQSTYAKSGLFTEAGKQIEGMGPMLPFSGPIGRWAQAHGSALGKEYESILGKEKGEAYQKSMNAQEQMNPLKKLSAEDYGQNYQSYLQSQRSMGLNYDTFHGKGGFREKTINAGFSDQMGMQASNEILGAGGSTRMAQNSALGLQMQRGMNMTNSNQILGNLSGSLGGDKATEQAMIRIYSEGTRIGLDDSKFAEENRRFNQTVSEIVSKSGTQSQSDISDIASGFSRFAQGDLTNKGLDSAKSAYEQYQQMSQETTGARGVMRAAHFMQDPALSKLSTITKQSLMSVPDNELVEDNPVLKQAAEEAGVSVEEIKNRVKKGNNGSMSRLAETDNASNAVLKGVRSYLKKNNKTAMSQEDWAVLPPDIQSNFNKLVTNQNMELPSLGMRGNISRAQGTVMNGMGMDEDTRKSLLESSGVAMGKLNNKDTGKIEDTTVQNIAESSKLAVSGLQLFSKEIGGSTMRAVQQFNTSILSASKALNAISDKNSPEYKKQFDNLTNSLAPLTMQPINQQQGGKTQK